MGAIIMSALVSVIAIVGGVYFWIQDKKETRKGMRQSALWRSCSLELYLRVTFLCRFSAYGA